MLIHNTLSDIAILLSIGLAAGALSGLFGIGGGVIIIPALIIFMSLTQHQAQGISLGMLLIPVALPAFLRYYKKERKHIKIKHILLISLGEIMGAYWGASLAVFLPGEMLKKIFALLLLYMGMKQLFKKNTISSRAITKSPTIHFFFILIGIITGLSSGLMGIGGGVVLVPALMLLGFSQHQAQGISLGKLSLPIGVFFSSWVYSKEGYTDFGSVFWLALGFAIASLLSAGIAVVLSADKLKKYFSAFIFCAGIYFLFS